ncbi:hypothetical protein [Mariprofundus sp. EBB-1]|uniref:hypothetical protein n=1 Tax=Mariprofundus sp. EBB-1 TaxID=2650971 RepID=UPI001F31AD7A|nr:hypothetical protein [Mariprofundus sp. EBB-1]
MSADNQITAKIGLSFPMVIAITALILSLASGIVNYRQNNLSNLESSLRDTRDQLQLAKNDITDIQMNTIQQLVDAELAIKNQAELKHENETLTEKLKESKIRMGELERQIKRMDDKISSQSSALKKAQKRAKASHSKTRASAKIPQPADKSRASNASASVEIYLNNIPTALQNSIIKSIKEDKFRPTFPALTKSMHLSKKTTIFYYNETYKNIANNLRNILMAQNKGKVLLKKGASAYAANKIIVHLIGQ